jgi:Arc/MetJ family transcription regulator
MLRCMRTTIDINDRLLAEAKSLAAQRGLSLKALVEEALRERLLARGAGKRAAVRLPTFSGNGLQAGVDLTDSATLLEAMDADAGR